MSEVCEDPDEEEESWEVRAFEEDVTTGNLLGGCTWPPRSYACTFCRRQFRSAQALGGHMNVHRRERASRQQTGPPPPLPTPTSSYNNNIVPNYGLGCSLIYALPNNNNNGTCQPTKAERTYSTMLPKDSPGIEELDLELRLGRRPPPPP